MSFRPLFRSPESPETALLREWHHDLIGPEKRGQRAGLRRTKVEEAILEPEFYRLVQRLGISPEELAPEQMEGLAALAVLAAELDKDTPNRSLGHSLGSTPPGSSRPPVSEARFRRLLTTMELKPRFNVLRRLIPLLGRSADLQQVAAVLLDWTSNRQRQLAYDYYSDTHPLSPEVREESAS